MGKEYDVTSGETRTIILNVEDLMRVSSGGYAYECVLSGGMIIGLSGGMIQDSVVSSGGSLVVSNSANGVRTRIRDGGIETLFSAGQEDDTTIEFGGLLLVSGSGHSLNAKVFAGGRLQAEGTGARFDGALLKGGATVVLNGGAGYSVAVSNGGLAEVSSGGFMASARVSAGGSMAVCSSGIAVSCTVSSGGRMRIDSGASVYNTTISGGEVNLANGADIRNATIGRGGSLIATGTAELPVSSGWKILVSSGGTAEVSSLNIYAGGQVTMDLKSTLVFQSIQTADASGFQLKDLGTYDPKTGDCRKLMDCAGGTAWTAEQYRSLLQCTEADFDSKFVYRDGDLYLQGIAKVSDAGAAGETFSTVQDALALNPLGVTVLDGTFTATDNVPTFCGLATTISGGTFDTSVCGGNFYDADEGAVSVGTAASPKNLSMTITGGEFNRIVFAGDRVLAATSLTRTGNLNLTIEGGTFHNFVAGGGAFTSTAGLADSSLVGNVTLTIRGGTFQADKWVYGGFMATNKTLAANTTITGTVTVRLDATEGAVTVSHVVAGSYGAGKIFGSTKLEVTGTSKITATDLWGGCSSDYYTIGGDAVTYVRNSGDTADGDRLLSFTGFRGVLDCAKIRDFTSAEFICDASNNASEVELNKACDMSYVSNWSFDFGCNLTGSLFKNDFAGDTFAYGKSSDVVTASWEGKAVLKDVGAAALKGFDSFSGVTLFGKTATWSDVANAYVTNIEGGSFNYKLYSTETGMAVGIA